MKRPSDRAFDGVRRHGVNLKEVAAPPFKSCLGISPSITTYPGGKSKVSTEAHADPVFHYL